MTTSEVTTRSDPGYELSRFNAVGHGLLSRNTLLPWEDRGEYDALLTQIALDHKPDGVTQSHLVEEIASQF